MAAVGSSISTSLALDSRVRAIATAWRWPPDIFRTRSRGRVSDLSSANSSAGAVDHRLLVEHAERPEALLDLAAEKHVLRGGQIVGERQILVDDLDALGARLDRLVEMADLAVDERLRRRLAENCRRSA